MLMPQQPVRLPDQAQTRQDSAIWPCREKYSTGNRVPVWKGWAEMHLGYTAKRSPVQNRAKNTQWFGKSTDIFLSEDASWFITEYP